MFVLPVVFLGLCSVTVSVAVPTVDFAPAAVRQLHKRTAECFPMDQVDTADLNPVDCVDAIQGMPIPTSLDPGDWMAVSGDFGNAVNVGSPFKLPRHFAKGNCMIGVTMVPAALNKGTDRSNWAEIALKATTIVSSCVSLPKPARRGGSDTAGRANHIKIEIFRYAPHLEFMIPLNDFMNPDSYLRPT